MLSHIQRKFWSQQNIHECLHLEKMHGKWQLLCNNQITVNEDAETGDFVMTRLYHPGWSCWHPSIDAYRCSSHCWKSCFTKSSCCDIVMEPMLMKPLSGPRFNISHSYFKFICISSIGNLCMWAHNTYESNQSFLASTSLGDTICHTCNMEFWKQCTWNCCLWSKSNKFQL